MRFRSTRGAPLTGFSDTLLEGLAPDGGLAVPERFPTVSLQTLEQWRSLSYAELATKIIGLFASDIAQPVLAELCSQAYGTRAFSDPSIVPLRRLDDRITLVGLSEGPTLAFKDLAMQFLGEAIDYTLTDRNLTLNILGATSGDTGSAAEYAFRNRERIRMFMLSPQGRMSEFQRAQMYSLLDENIHNIAIRGVFDQCQDLVKEISNDVDFKNRYRLGAVNSINFGRISAQIVYYFWSWLRTTDSLPDSQEVSFSVPSGNFGNALSGYYAKLMGLPIRRIIIATNENNVLEEFFQTGRYRPRPPEATFATSSPSMDISRASNLERFVFDILGRDPLRLVETWEKLHIHGEFTLREELDECHQSISIASGSSSHHDRLKTIRETWHNTGHLVDPHTADGIFVGQQYVDPGIPMLVLETAKPQKFTHTISEALGEEIIIDSETAKLLKSPQRVTEMPYDVNLVRAFIESHALR